MIGSSWFTHGSKCFFSYICTIIKQTLMKEQDHLIGILRIKVENKLGRKLVVPTDFNWLILRMQADTGESLSISTLKRIWKYADPSHQISDTSLSCLARFIGYKDWSGFLAAHEEKGEVDSDFLMGKQIHADALREGDTLEIGWEPDRYCRIVHLEKDLFEVQECRNGRLEAGDTFHANTFSLGLPLCVTDIHRGNKIFGAYVAGRKKGLILLNLFTK